MYNYVIFIDGQQVSSQRSRTRAEIFLSGVLALATITATTPVVEVKRMRLAHLITPQ